MSTTRKSKTKAPRPAKRLSKPKPKSAARKSVAKKRARDPMIGHGIETPSGRPYIVSEVVVIRPRVPRLLLLRPVVTSSTNGPRQLLLPESLVKKK